MGHDTEPLPSTLTHLTVIAGEGEYLADFEPTDHGWLMAEEILDEENLLTGEQSRTVLRSLRHGVGDFAETFGLEEVRAKGAEPAAVFEWLRPVLPEYVDHVLINDVAFSLSEDEAEHE